MHETKGRRSGSGFNSGAAPFVLSCCCATTARASVLWDTVPAGSLDAQAETDFNRPWCASAHVALLMGGIVPLEFSKDIDCLSWRIGIAHEKSKPETRSRFRLRALAADAERLQRACRCCGRSAFSRPSRACVASGAERVDTIAS